MARAVPTLISERLPVPAEEGEAAFVAGDRVVAPEHLYGGARAAGNRIGTHGGGLGIVSLSKVVEQKGARWPPGE